MEQLSNKACKVIENRKNLYKLLNATLQGVRRLFVLAYFIAAGANKMKGSVRSVREKQENMRLNSVNSRT